MRHFGKWLAHEGSTVMNGISVLIKEAPEISHRLLSWEDIARRKAVCGLGNGLSPDTVSAWTLSLDFQLPELWEINVCCL